MYEVDQYTASLLHFDNGIKDETGKVWTANGGAVISTEKSKFGGSSLFFDGLAGSYLSTAQSADFTIGANEKITIDFWVYPLASGRKYAFQMVCNGNDYQGYVIAVSDNATGTNVFATLGAGSSCVYATSSTAVPLNTWSHLAYVVDRDAQLIRFFINGVQVAKSGISGISTGSLVANPILGGRYNNNSTQQFKGYIDEFRVSKGIARWTEDFTPPTAPPVNLPTSLMAAAGDSQVTLSWNTVTEATGYNVKRSTTAGGPYTIIATNVTGTSYVDTIVTNGTTYYYVVTAVNADGESGNSNEASATPQAPSGHGLLRITMNDSSEREYRLTTVEIEKFIKWYDRTVCTGNTCYAFDDIVDDSKEYLSFEKIISFKVIPLAK